jgi:hypothetical protein
LLLFRYTPKHSGPTTINVTLGEEGHVADSPYKIDVQPKVDKDKTLVFGPGLENGILDTHPQHFNIETRDQARKKNERKKELCLLKLFCAGRQASGAKGSRNTLQGDGRGTQGKRANKGQI